MQDQDIKYVGFWARTVASFLDTLLIAMVTGPILYAIYGADYFVNDNPVIFAGPLDFLISWVFPIVAIISFWIIKQATPGKMAFSAIIVDAKTGNRASTGQLIGRYFAYFLSTIPLCLGFFWVAFDRRKQGWHDKLAGTLVIKKP